jgi:UDP-N-acetylmuramoyl-L-alanyl-D-glutamate--2,6-diaminopimelate ligase
VIDRVVYDSRKAGPGALFAALPGTKVDGHAFLEQVAAQGASAALVSRAWLKANPTAAPLPCFPVEDTRIDMARVACELFGHPSRKLKLVGVTGTNGKTTTTNLIRAIMDEAGLSSGILGTLGVVYAGRQADTGHTTPQSPDLQALLAEMVEAGVHGVAMEVSSHAIDQARVYGCAFQAVVHTNVSQDHLDYHGTMEAYTEVKTRLFNWKATGHPPGRCVVNVDDPSGVAFRRAAGNLPVITYGIDAGPSALLWASDIESFPAGSRFRVHWEGTAHPVSIALPGRFNIYNALAAFGAGLALGHPPDLIATALARAPGVPGRAEVVTEAGAPFTVWVDYAHTPDGLVNVLEAARALNPKRLIVVFGCGGDRDRTKRPLMGEAASRLADLTILTSDNPRSEDPLAILAEIAPGVKGDYQQIPDRAEAIGRAIGAAQPGDLVVIAGKGHETYQIFADRTIHFDDREEARAAIARLRPSPC